jgi:hypothetical protein
MEASLAIIICLPLVLAGGLFLLVKMRPKANASRIPYLLVWNIFLICFFMSCIVLAGEIYFRGFVDRTDGANLTPVSKRWFKKYYRYNNAGFRDDVDYALVRDGSVGGRVTFIGDSFTAGHGVKDVNDRFANILRGMMPELEIHVLAQNGLETIHQINLIDELPYDYDMDLVILIYVLNDISYLIDEMADVHIATQEYLSSLPGFVHGSWFLTELAAHYYVHFRPEARRYYDHLLRSYGSEHLVAHEDDLKRLHQNVRDRGGRLMVVTFPLFDQLDEDYAFRVVHDHMAAFWRGLDVPHLDLVPIYEGRDFRDLRASILDAHPNETAHRLAAQEILAFIRAFEGRP